MCKQAFIKQKLQLFIYFLPKNDFEVNTNKIHHNLTFLKNLYVKSNELINKDFDILKFSNSINQRYS